MTLLRETQSLCPVCLRRIPARYETDAQESSALKERSEMDASASQQTVFLRKHCPEHGSFSVVVWQGEPAFTSWASFRHPSYPEHPATADKLGCPFDCGLCPEHGQHTCTGLVEVTARCNMRCPVCYAKAEPASVAPDPTPERIREQFASLFRASGACNLQLSGGEPTVRVDLPELIRMARETGFAFVQLNSNGLRLGSEPGYARHLKEAGLDSVYLQCDGVSEETFRVLRGRSCLDDKQAAIRACTEAGLGVVLVATLVSDINLREVGDLLRFALSCGPGVRGVHFQPVASFGRFPWELTAAPRVTLPELMRELQCQSDGLVRITDFHPPGCEHALCSFSAVYLRKDARLECLPASADCCTPAFSENSEGARRAKAFVARHWRAEESNIPEPAPLSGKNTQSNDFEQFLASAGIEQRFTVSAMGFQDALSLDIARVRGCCIHVVEPSGHLVPFCLYNITSRDGIPLYRGKA